MELSEFNYISIVQILVYIPIFAASIILCLRHGWGSEAGWLLVVIFSISRVVGASLQLATIAQPHNIGLLFGAVTLQGVGVSDLIILLLSLIKRALVGIERARSTIIQPRVLSYTQLFVLVGVILTAVGGSNAGTHYAKTGEYEVSSLSEAGLALTLAGYALTLATTVVVGMNISHAEPGEKRLVLAVALSLPFLLVRLIYSAGDIFGHNPTFRLTTGSITIFLGLAVIEEIAIAVIVVIIGLTLQIRPKSDLPPSEPGMLGKLYKRLQGRFQEQQEGRLGGGRGGRRGRYAMQRLDPQGYAPQGQVPQVYAPRERAPSV